MSYLDTDIKKLYGVGEARAKAYSALGITTVGDLLEHYPRGYEDRGDIKLLSEVDDFSKHAFLLTVATEPKSVRLKNRMTLTKFTCYDDSAYCEMIFFNQDFVRSVFTLGSTFRFFGKLDRSSKGLSMSSPVYERWEEEASLPSLVAVYPLSAKLSQKQIAKDVRSALVLAACDREEDPLPEEIRLRHKLCTRAFAQKNIHFPDNFSSLAAAKKRLIFDEFFSFALGVSVMGLKGKRAEAYPCLNSDISSLLRRLPYELTGAQKRVVEDIRCDMEKNTAMSRIVIGDVGCGKTVCAAAAMLFAVQSGYQAALMAPTEILARQHYASIRETFEPLGIRVALLLGATTVSEKRKIYTALKAEGEGRIDVVIGTHALLSEGVEFSSLGLAVIDEQHRFGVGQRSALAKKNPLTHTLVMSATPIPRSLALALYGDLDISMIDEIPAGRQVVDTFVVDESYRARLNAFIRKQVADGGQVYVVCPAVEEVEDKEEETDFLLGQIGVEGALIAEDEVKLKSAIAFSEELSAEFPDLSVDFLHGKLKAREKEEKMARFVSGQTDILVSTTVIEVGVNVPNASLMIVENAERFGLSQLHQLRGRVGRGVRKSYCVFVSDSIKKNGLSKERLMTVKNSHDGYHIAEKDLAMRGPGDFLKMSRDAHLRQSGGVRFKLAELCDDTGLMTLAFSEARAILQGDPSLSSHPALKKQIESLFVSDTAFVN